MRTMTLGTKVIVVMVFMLTIITAVTTYVLVAESRSNLAATHDELRLSNQNQLNLIKTMLTERLVVWVEAFSQQALANQKSISSLEQQLEYHYDMLRLQWHVENIWIVDKDGNVSGPTVPNMTAALEALISRTQNQIRPMESTHCNDVCHHMVSVPVLIGADNIAVVVVATAMQELVALLNESVNARASIVGHLPNIDDSSILQLKTLSPLNAEASLFMQGIIDQISPMALSELVLSGAQIEWNDKHYSAFLLPLEQANSMGFYMLVVQDQTHIIRQVAVFQAGVLVSAGVLFVIFTFLTFYLFTRFRSRLLNLSQRLPLLAQRKFDQFKDQKLEYGGRHLLGLPDELDILEQATENLSIELATLDAQNRKNLRKLEKMAMYDALTDLPNRNMLNFQIEKQLALSLRNKLFVSLMFIDLDDFKKVNDAFGHDKGDKLLQIAGQRIAQTVRDADIVTRFGGDEFVVLLTDIENIEQLKIVADKLISAFASPLNLDSKPFYVSISIGVAATQNSEFSSVELLKHADIAMFEAKSVNGSAYRIFASNMNKKIMRRVDMESAARSAMLENQFALALQPIIDLDTRLLIGFEALLRWHHPEKGMIPPGEFIPVIENTPFMLQLDYWVIARACRILLDFKENGLDNVKLCINLSASQFTDPSLPEYLSDQLLKYDVEPGNLQLELTETALVADMATTIKIIEKIRSLGCKIAIDDFGTGYASLSYLKNIPADVVKLDQSFIGGMMDNQSDRNIVFATVSMVSSIGQIVVAEGIEMSSQYELLCHFGCQQGQGYLISRPINEDKLWEELQEKLSQGRWHMDIPIFGENENQMPLL